MIDKKVGIIGAGNMGSALFDGFRTVVKTESLFIFDNDEAKVKALKPARLLKSNEELFDLCEVVFLAIKPQTFERMFAKISVDVKDKLIVSIMAGVNLQKLAEITKATKVIRSMPNLAAKIGHSVTGWLGNESVSSEDKKSVKTLFAAVGTELELFHEKQIDFLTAISGSGPAYFFYLAELLAKQAFAFGFDREEAEILAKKTLLGSAELLNQCELTAMELKNQVTSKGGTTEAALNYLSGQNFESIVQQAIIQASKRSIELSGN